MELGVDHTGPGRQGDPSTGGTKPATLETGAEIAVPLFVNTGDRLKVDTRDGRYLGRANWPDLTWPLDPRHASAPSTSSTPPTCAAATGATSSPTRSAPV